MLPLPSLLVLDRLLLGIELLAWVLLGQEPSEAKQLGHLDHLEQLVWLMGLVCIPAVVRATLLVVRTATLAAGSAYAPLSGLVL